MNDKDRLKIAVNALRLIVSGHIPASRRVLTHESMYLIASDALKKIDSNSFKKSICGEKNEKI